MLFDEVALDHVHRHLPLLPRPEIVELEQRRADQLEDLEPGAFDAVVLNSVVQYFPNADYLLRVVDGGIGAVGPGGERVTAPITVTGAAGEGASVLGVQEGTWRSSVEPGQYTVSATGPDGLRTETVEVRTGLVRHDITLP